ncbi:hypothetical protein, variant [Cladophialophora immunda]|uniref:MARVEL domain-containing protein n=1 Tax=Cladophialophora immunda TaxID=569365 RepID=A0A0D2BXA5_9EURO|nr:uncharacterized protein PV07_11196 [Cladophialophora immunda]XP_016243172.1 hypothetical protein, variant [Cladophialophora immunda]KIW22955.1 hypothetical protein PV07_11196 [Cladophialophora immunda]KIW22956.1 hypothetical protein, variant [Cladophialophora immunda]OQU93749.1 hypothetical protein CLAIMM_00226 isoform 1 [Cladophialophora immunda]OQU93750.1 hypothetical protein CLAIMM_00226 isoform 2 [Cladophialophora immunda]OQU93751.1 hypothetical protein CLAIMM_00226 isoform 3 [Cladophi
MDPHQSSYEPFRHARDGYDADRHMDAAADDETLLKQEDHARQQHAMNQPRSQGGRLNNERAPRARFQTIRTVFRVLSLVLAITILGIQAYSIYVWLKTRRQSTRNQTTGFQTMIWAIIDPWPTWVMLGAAVAAVVVHFIAFGSLCGCCQSARRGASHVWAVYLSSSLLLSAWIAALVYFKVVDSMGDKKKNWDLWSWSCHKRSTKDGDVAWNALCIENNYTFFAAIVVVLLEGLGLILFIASQHSAKMNMPSMKMPKLSGYRRF